MYCNSCGKEIQEGSNFCRYCGEKIEVQNENQQTIISEEKQVDEEHPVEKQGNRKIVFIGIIAVMIILVSFYATKLNNGISGKYADYVGQYVAEYNGTDYIMLDENGKFHIVSNGGGAVGKYATVGNQIEFELSDGRKVQAQIFTDRISGFGAIWVKNGSNKVSTTDNGLDNATSGKYADYVGQYVAEYNGIDYIMLDENGKFHTVSNGVGAVGKYVVVGNQIEFELSDGRKSQAQIYIDKISGFGTTWVKNGSNNVSTVDNGLDEEVQFSDMNLEKALRNYLNINPQGKITKRYMQGLKQLQLPIENIAVLNGLEYAINLEALNLGGNNIYDITPIGSLKKLKFLNLRENKIEDVAPLANLNYLEDLRISYNAISDIYPLSNLTNLSTLEMDNNNITNFSPLANLGRLTSLCVSCNPISLEETRRQIDDCYLYALTFLDVNEISLDARDMAYYESLEDTTVSNNSPIQEQSNLLDVSNDLSALLGAEANAAIKKLGNDYELVYIDDSGENTAIYYDGMKLTVFVDDDNCVKYFRFDYGYSFEEINSSMTFDEIQKVLGTSKVEQEEVAIEESVSTYYYITYKLGNGFLKIQSGNIDGTDNCIKIIR